MVAPGELHYRNGVCHLVSEVHGFAEDTEGVTWVTFTPRGSTTSLKRSIDFRNPPVTDHTCHFAHQCREVAT